MKEEGVTKQQLGREGFLKLVALVLGVYRYGAVAEKRFGTRGGNFDKAAAVSNRIVYVPEKATYSLAQNAGVFRAVAARYGSRRSCHRSEDSFDYDIYICPFLIVFL